MLGVSLRLVEVCISKTERWRTSKIIKKKKKSLCHIWNPSHEKYIIYTSVIFLFFIITTKKKKLLYSRLSVIVEESVSFRSENFVSVSELVWNTLLFHLRLKSGPFWFFSTISAHFGKYRLVYKFQPVWMYKIKKKNHLSSALLLLPASSMALLNACIGLFFFFLSFFC